MIRVCKIGKIIWKSKYKIIKDDSGIRRGNYKKVLVAYQLFENKFSKELNDLDKKARWTFEADMSGVLWKLAKMSQNKENILQSLDTAKHYNQLSFFDKLLIKHISIFLILLYVKFSLKYGKMHYLYTLLRKLKITMKGNMYKDVIPTDEYTILKKALKNQSYT